MEGWVDGLMGGQREGQIYYLIIYLFILVHKKFKQNS